MAQQVQFRRGTTAEHSTFTGAVGEVTVDTDKDVIVVHDGSTAGGFPLVKAGDIGTSVQAYDADTAKTDVANTFTAAQTFSAGLSGSLAGNASTATSLETARSIQGVSFDGTANIDVVSAGAGITITGTAVSIATTSNGFGTRTVSSDDPTGGTDGDIWLRV